MFDIEAAAQRLEAAKAAEIRAIAQRMAAEDALLSMVGDLPTEGSSKFDAGQLRVTITTSLRRKIDPERLAQIAPSIPEAIGKRLIKWEPALVLRELRYIESNDPELYTILAYAFEAKPGKPAIKVEPVQVKEAA